MALLDRLAGLDLACLHLLEGPDADLTTQLRQAWPGTFILNPFTHPDATGPDALKLIENGSTDLVAYGALFLANPDLPRRLAVGGPFNTPDPSVFYGGDRRPRLHRLPHPHALSGAFCVDHVVGDVRKPARTADLGLLLR